MNKGTIYTIQSKSEDYPDNLRHIPDPPTCLYVQGTNWQQLLTLPWVAIVGSRRITSYGQAITSQLASELAAAGVVVVSGLALGVDGAAHKAALEAKGLTVAVLAGGLDTIYPASHYHLAERIYRQGGALVSEYPKGTPSRKHHFIARNRLVSGLSRTVVITEAAEKSGTLHTVRFALEQGREVFAVPGNITSPLSAVPNRLIQTGASLLTKSADVLQALGITQPSIRAPTGANKEEQVVLNLLNSGETQGAQLLTQSQLSVSVFNQTLTMLEISGKIRALGNNQWTITY